MHHALKHKETNLLVSSWYTHCLKYVGYLNKFFIVKNHPDYAKTEKT